ncbi:MULTISPECIES: DUF418 domain-containing protein [unclassified Ensifer]|uniref:DUF418 domain-containing protein n=1 Tax=unclassified Ensifer TaxID=2633371 RepID=UPI000812D075|nr:MULTISPECIES: DUF418 domain-containing protein [unclassified Ensifer]OCP00865.1 hypothetical protein BBX50_06675 [Ensifer sp. LC11]OCP01433.1 hypothetical protein BC374_06735 [Ensifer sp. LC13]OCP01981.1 hypothetical protein BC362_19635 [Ensifer sp. LC14]OCP30187.1 hypothetical protein BC364_07525 [Ensifer sp. LC499]
MNIQDRIDDVDALRGFALLGILLVNSMAFASAFYGLEIADPAFAGTTDSAVHLVVALFFEMKFYLLFSFLFGYSFTLQMRSAEKSGEAFVPRLLRRQAGLWLIGIAHAVLLFHGDILTTYAVLGIVLLMLRNRSDSALLRLARWLVIVVAIAWGALGIVATLEPTPLDRPAILAAAEAAELAFGGDWQAIIAQHLAELSSVWVILGLLQAPCALAMFLLGLVAGRQKMLARPQENQRLFRRLVRSGLWIGLPGAVIYAYASVEWIDSPLAITGLAVGLITGPFLTGAYVGGVMLFFGTSIGQHLRNLLAPAGRMALSNYLMQSLILAFIFHGYGLGLIGQASPLATALTSLGIFTAQLFLSRWWMARFAYGPLEWILRFITIWRAPQWRKPVEAR